MVRFSCKVPNDIGIIVHIYEKHIDFLQRIDVLWEDGIWTQNVEDLEVIDEE